jgi:predicted O-methyltransferase YrrM
MLTQTTLELNEELLSRARAVLGTQGIKDTIDQALVEVIVADARRKVLAHLRTLDVDTDALRGDAWRA